MVEGKARSFHTKFKFVIEIDGVVSAAFMTCSELAAEFGVIAHREGGSLTAQKRPGLLNFDDITLERGATNDQDLFNWFKEVADAAANAGLVEPAFLRTFDIVQLDRDGGELKRYTCFDVWPMRFVAGEWDNDAEENVIESVVLSIDRFDLAA